MSALAPITSRWEDLEADLAPLRNKLLNHPLYAAVSNLSRVQFFMQQHVFAVWDFMSLLKRLQQVVTCTTAPWLPPADPVLCRFLNEIVLGEESDNDGEGGHCSHFELYRRAMEDCGASTKPINTFIRRVSSGESPYHALGSEGILRTTQDFVRHTLAMASHGSPHAVAAAFAVGREDLIPEMFQRLLPSLEKQGKNLDRLVYYIRRHIEVDGDHHGPLAQRLLERLTENRDDYWEEALEAGRDALQARIRLWDGIHWEITHSPK